MKKVILLLLASLTVLPASEDWIEVCFKDDECGEVYELSSDEFDGEAKEILNNLEKLKVGVYKAYPYYFKNDYRGLYYPDDNNIFLNMGYIGVHDDFLNILRHESWHVVQDCKDGLYNSSLQKIWSTVPQQYTEEAKKRYGLDPTVIRIEREALWAGETYGMSAAQTGECVKKYGL